MQNTKRSSGFTLIELLVVVSIIGLLIGILLPALSRAKKQAQALKCGAQLRETHRGLVTFAQNNRDRYPTPSRIDNFGYTEQPASTEPDGSGGQPDGAQRQKDRTGAIYSLLIYQGLITPELAVTPSEADGRIKPDRDFQFGQVSQAEDDERAAWDPGFVGTLSIRDNFVVPSQMNQDNQPDVMNAGDGSNCSYAHIALYGNRFVIWSNTYAADDVIIGNRGPVYTVENPGPNAEYTLLGTGTGGPESEAGFNSITLLIHGQKRSWSGNVTYNDGHVKFEGDHLPENVRMEYDDDGDGNVEFIKDSLFEDESFELSEGAYTSNIRNNVYLRQWPVGIASVDVDADLEDIATWDGKQQDWGQSF